MEKHIVDERQLLIDLQLNVKGAGKLSIKFDAEHSGLEKIVVMAIDALVEKIKEDLED